jgi:hypothetical protein
MMPLQEKVEGRDYRNRVSARKTDAHTSEKANPILRRALTGGCAPDRRMRQ